MSQIHSIVPVFQVTDVAAAISHYVDAFGFTEDWIMDDFYGSVSRDGQSIHFGKSEANGSSKVYLMASGVDELYAEIEPKGVDIVSALTSQPYGMRDFYVSDGFGNVVGFGEELGHE